MYVKDPNAKGLATDMAVTILSDYIDALAAGEYRDVKELLEHVPAVDQETLAELFKLARELRDELFYEHLLITPEVKKRIWQKIEDQLKS